MQGRLSEWLVLPVKHQQGLMTVLEVALKSEQE
jgi:hypothetical protein